VCESRIIVSHGVRVRARSRKKYLQRERERESAYSARARYDKRFFGELIFNAWRSMDVLSLPMCTRTGVLFHHIFTLTSMRICTSCTTVRNSQPTHTSRTFFCRSFSNVRVYRNDNFSRQSTFLFPFSSFYTGTVFSANYLFSKH
jgi:hypothetical protein